MGKTLSNDIKWRIIYHQLDGFSAKETAHRLYLSVATVYNVRKIYDHWGCVTHPFKGRQGRRKTLNSADLNVFNY
jgi:transposase